MHLGKTSAGLKIIIVGAGKVGTSLVEQLSQEGHDITLIDKNPVKLRERCNCTVPEYILRGKFRAICTDEEKLTENNMMECNIDIRNRYYTLICREVITDSKLQV